jgi:hypothetical protein
MHAVLRRVRHCLPKEGQCAGWPIHAGYHKGHLITLFCLASECRGHVVVSSSDDTTMDVLRRDHDNKGGGRTCIAAIEGCLVDTGRMR